MEITTVEEQPILAEFRKRVADLKLRDRTLLRFLRARRHNLQAAEDMLRNHIEWRQSKDIDRAAKWIIPEHILEGMPYEDLGSDYQGNYVRYVNLTTWGKFKLVQRGYLMDVLRLLYQLLEYDIERTDETGNKHAVIVDLEGLTFAMVSNYQVLQASLNFFRCAESNYPEFVGRLMVINAPYIFNWVWSLVKPCLTGDTISKVEVFKGNEEEYIPVMLQRFPILPSPYREKSEEYKFQTKICAPENQVLLSNANY